MGVFTYDMEIDSPIPPAKLFKAFVLDGDTFIPKALPEVVKSIQIIKGDGGAGTIKNVSFAAVNQFTSATHRVDELQRDNYVYQYTIIAGDVLLDVVESMSYAVKIEASRLGSTCKITTTYNTMGNAEIKEEDIKRDKDHANASFRAIEAYLQANPDCLI